MSNPFSPEFSGSSLADPSSTTISNKKKSSMASSQFLAPCTNSDLATGIDPFAASLAFGDPFANVNQPTGLPTSELAYGGSTWTSPLQQQQLSVPPPLPQQQQYQQQSTSTGLSGLACPPPKPSLDAKSSNDAMMRDAMISQQRYQVQSTTTGGLSGLVSPPPNSSLDANSSYDAMMGGPMGGTAGGTSTCEEDEEFLQAQRAALEAKAILEKQAQQQQQKQEGGFLGLKHLIPKQPNFLRKDIPPQQQPQVPNNNAPWLQSASPTRGTSTPPWHPPQQDHQAAATSDFGIPPPATDTTTVANVNTQNNPPGKGAAVMGASVVGGVAGLMLVGPLVGVVAAGGAAYAAGTKEGPVGSIFRGTGSLAASAGGAAKRFDNRHQVVGKTVKGVAAGVGWVVQTVNGATPDS